METEAGKPSRAVQQCAGTSPQKTPPVAQVETPGGSGSRAQTAARAQATPVSMCASLRGDAGPSTSPSGAASLPSSANAAQSGSAEKVALQAPAFASATAHLPGPAAIAPTPAPAARMATGPVLPEPCLFSPVPPGASVRSTTPNSFWNPEPSSSGIQCAQVSGGSGGSGSQHAKKRKLEEELTPAPGLPPAGTQTGSCQATKPDQGRLASSQDPPQPAWNGLEGEKATTAWKTSGDQARSPGGSPQKPLRSPSAPLPADRSMGPSPTLFLQHSATLNTDGRNAADLSKGPGRACSQNHKELVARNVPGSAQPGLAAQDGEVIDESSQEHDSEELLGSQVPTCPKPAQCPAELCDREPNRMGTTSLSAEFPC